MISARKSPWQNLYVERIIGSIRRECTDQIIALGERHLLRTLMHLEGNAPEPRPVEEGNPQRQTAYRTQSRESEHNALEWVRQVAKSNKDAQFTALLHHVTVDRHREAYEGINPKAAPGVDGVTWSWYGQDVEVHLRDLRRGSRSGDGSLRDSYRNRSCAFPNHPGSCPGSTTHR